MSVLTTNKKNKNLKILVISPTNFKVCDHNAINSGSIEQFTYILSEELAKRGHQVTLFATKDSQLPNGVKLGYVFKNTPSNYYHLDPSEIWTRDLVQASSALKHACKFDYVINHTMGGIPIIELLKAEKFPIISSTTIHWRFTDKRLVPLLNMYRNHPLIVISRHAKKGLHKNNVKGLVPYGLKPAQWPFTPKKQDYLLFVGKIIPDKGVDLAIKVARKLGKKLIIAGRVINERYPKYFDKEIAPYLNHKIKYVGEISGSTKIDLFKNAEAFLSPGRWSEPFGVVFIEAQACGTPVIGWNPGSSNDSIIDKQTGFVINAKNDSKAIDEIVMKLKKIDTINPYMCRKNVEENFTIEKTANEYEKIISKQIKAINK